MVMESGWTTKVGYIFLQEMRNSTLVFARLQIVPGAEIEVRVPLFLSSRRVRIDQPWKWVCMPLFSFVWSMSFIRPGRKVPRPLEQRIYAERVGELLHFDYLYIGESCHGPD